jgi:myosin heavy subunit
MQSDDHQKPGLDDDILQCKLDLQRALQAAKRVPPKHAAPPEQTVDMTAQSSQPLQSEIQEELYPDSNLHKTEGQESAHPPVGIHIMPFERLHNKTRPSASPDSPPPPLTVEPDKIEKQPQELIEQLNDKIHRLEKQLEEEKLTHNQLISEADELRKSLVAQQRDAEQLRAELQRKSESLNDAVQHLAEIEQQLGILPDEHRRQMAVLEGHLQGKTTQLDKIAEQNRRLQESLDASVVSVNTLREQVEEMELQLSEKISQITALKQNIEENAAALAADAEEIRRAGDAKETAENQLELKAAEWAKTLEALKVAQDSAARLLSDRQHQLDAIHEKLSDAERRLEQADSANAMLARENAELIETLQNERRQAKRFDEVMSGFEFENREEAVHEEVTPEPYCEPVGEVISEDDVHLEQKLTEESVPTFNLAEQIMAEHRKASAGRRQGPGGSGEKTTQRGAIEHVIQQYISDAQTPVTPSQPAAPQTPSFAERSFRFLRWQGESLSAYQESLLSTIIQKDIRRYCGMGVPSKALHQPTDN